MAKGQAKKREFITSTQSKRPEETDSISAVDSGIDFVKSGESAQVGHGLAN